MNSKMMVWARVFLLFIVVLAGLYQLTNKQEISAGVSPIRQVVGQPVRVSDSTSQAKTWLWESGNGQKNTTNKGSFYYSQPGTYLIRLTIDKQVSKTFTVVITPTADSTDQDAVVRIEGPTEGFEREELVFKAVGGKPQKFAWRFGNSRQVDSRDQTAIYSFPMVEKYRQPKPYIVELITDVTKAPIRHLVKIRQGYNKFDPIIDSLDITGDDFRKRLQLIANGQSFNSQYKYLINKYLCRNDNAPVTINDKETNDFYSYCMGLQFDQGIHIDAVAVVTDSTTSCVVRLNVTQHK